MSLIRYAWKLFGLTFFGIFALLTAAFLAVCYTGGDAVHWGYLGFEVIFPFFASVAIGEWGKTRADCAFELIAAQGKSLFAWICGRFAAVFIAVGAFAAIGIIGVSAIKQSMPTFVLFAAYISTALFFSSLSAFASLLTPAPHAAAMAVGLVWLLALMAQSLLRFPFVPYLYPFALYGGVYGVTCIINKMIFVLLSIVLWCGIYLICKKRPAFILG